MEPEHSHKSLFYLDQLYPKGETASQSSVFLVPIHCFNGPYWWQCRAWVGWIIWLHRASTDSYHTLGTLVLDIPTYNGENYARSCELGIRKSQIQNCFELCIHFSQLIKDICSLILGSGLANVDWSYPRNSPPPPLWQNIVKSRRPC